MSLSNREEFALTILIGLLQLEGMGFSQAIDESVRLADELIQRLKEEPQKE